MQDKSPNPGIKTIDGICLGLGLPSTEVIALGLHEQPEQEPGFKESKFAHLGRTYKQVRKDKRPIADELIKILNDAMERWH